MQRRLLGDAVLADESGSVKLTLWNEQIDMVNVGDKTLQWAKAINDDGDFAWYAFLSNGERGIFRTSGGNPAIS